MRILMIASELTPWVKVGGLGDVLGALPKALAARGHQVHIVCPFYGHMPKNPDWKRDPKPLLVRMKLTETAYVWDSCLPELPQVQVHWIEHAGHFGHRSGPYEDIDQDPYFTGLRFAFLTRAALDLALAREYPIDVVHLHDWPTSLGAVYLNTTDRHSPLGNCASVLTIHNLHHQGVFDKNLMTDTSLPWSEFRMDSVESLGAVNCLKGGIYHATKITTVSPTYAREIQTPALGCGLHQALQVRSPDLIGILNGIDTQVWDPQTDPYLPENYQAHTLSGKATCKKILQDRFQLKTQPDVPIFASVARLYPQKGIDVLCKIAHRIMHDLPIQLVILGTGEAEQEQTLRALQNQYPGRIGVCIGYEVQLEHLIQAGADFFVMPSRFEPCGLTQLYAMRYGTVPIVHATGGLIDSVLPHDPSGQTGGTGFVFHQMSEEALYDALAQACDTYCAHPSLYAQLQHNGMSQDFSWDVPAQIYENVYQWALDARRGSPADPLPSALKALPAAAKDGKINED